ncbi:Alpha/Beta hydrolase protein [Naematelia encephala]|uniref:Alpha/Beta hydrolase protein n=1 Tax=Naematelia encephala TaxID=71784 RepID=A0A1Y2BCD8_9TREE|nr:Alpha/Beta hydrolase protein [Naematelia encephala]
MLSKKGYPASTRSQPRPPLLTAYHQQQQNMFILSLILIAYLGVSTLAAPTTRPTSSASCQTFYANIYAEATNLDLASCYGGQPPASSQVWIQSQVDQMRAGSTWADEFAALPKINVSGTYQLYFEYCVPRSGKPKAVFLGIPGLMCGSEYWNLDVNGNTKYSFAESAAAAGYATLSYDRLGNRHSAHPDGLNVVQSSYEIAQAAAITAALRNGTLHNLGKFDKIIGLGHSYGSVVTSGVPSIAPLAYDAIVLTGFSGNVTAGPLGGPGINANLANVVDKSRFGTLSNAYLISSSIYNDQIEFMHYPNCTDSTLNYFNSIKTEFSMGTLFTVYEPYSLSRSDYTHPVLVITGNMDAAFCDGNCQITSLQSGQTQLDTARDLFPAVPTADFETITIPDTAHGINFHESAPSAYQDILTFVKNKVA